MNYLESIILCWVILDNLINKHALELNKIRWILLSFIIIYKQTLISQYIVSFSHNWGPPSNFIQFTFLHNFWVQRHCTRILNFKKLTRWKTFIISLFYAIIIKLIVISFFLFVLLLFLLLKIFLIILNLLVLVALRCKLIRVDFQGLDCVCFW
jgi:hypothetical protein